MGNANETSAERLSAGFKEIGIDCPAEIVAGWSLENMISDVQIDDVCTLLSSIRTLIDSRRATMLKNMSRIPQAARKTFGNFDMSRLSKGNDGLVRHLESLDFISLGENVVIVGDPGTGKTQTILTLIANFIFVSCFLLSITIFPNLGINSNFGKSRF